VIYFINFHSSVASQRPAHFTKKIKAVGWPGVPESNPGPLCGGQVRYHYVHTTPLQNALFILQGKFLLYVSQLNRKHKDIRAVFRKIILKLSPLIQVEALKTETGKHCDLMKR
jgi:hypothetical protein